MPTNDRLKKIDAKLEEKVREKPMLQHVLDLRILGRAVLFAAIAALVMFLLVGPATAGFMLLLVFFGSWYALARAGYERRRESHAAEADDERSEGERQPAAAG